MAHLIDKDALVAEIERRIQFFTEESGNSNSDIVIALCGLKSFLDTIEVKEVNLENSVKGRIDYPLIGYDFPNIYPNYKELKDYCDRNSIRDEDKVKIIIIKDNIL